jgi:hypothetical protein
MRAEYDNVNHPKHYMLSSGVEVIDIIKAVCNEGVEEYYRGNILKYVCRYKEKGGAESLKKARWYLNELISLQEKREARNDDGKRSDSAC